MQQIIIHIPKPCHENWDAMDAAEQGRFCLSCQKQVVDFSVMTDQQVLQYLQQNTGSTCGRFAPDQLHRSMTKPQTQHNRFWAKWVMQLIFPTFLFMQKVKAQKPVFSCFVIQERAIDKPIPVNNHQIATAQTPALKGKIIDSLTGKALGNASIQIKGQRIGIQSGIDGSFLLPIFNLAPKAILTISYTGYKTKQIEVKDIHAILNISLSPDFIEMAPIIVSVINDHFVKGDYQLSLTTIKQDTTKPIIKRIVDTLTGNNNISVYPNPVVRGHNLSLNMKKVQKGNYHLQLFSNAGSLVQQATITVPSEKFNFQWLIGAQLAAGNYIINIINSKGQQTYNSQITVL